MQHTGLTYHLADTIAALSTPPGTSATALIRVSGAQALHLVQSIFVSRKNLHTQPSHTAHYGKIQEGKHVLDEVVVTLFKAPRSFTKEDVVEISCHGSPYIVRAILQLLVRQGARVAEPGEFTYRAFVHGRYDLTQAEAVANLIEAQSQAAHQLALAQMRGSISKKLQGLRAQLIRLTALVELELDFAEEDVAFASRQELTQLVVTLRQEVAALLESFALGNALQQGIATVLVGKPNAGKSTLFNALLEAPKALVTDLPGTTRDVLEDTITIDGIQFRFIDTAGLREAQDPIEAMGIAKGKARRKEAQLVVHLFDLTQESLSSIQATLDTLSQDKTPYVAVGNKIDQADTKLQQACSALGLVLIAAKEKTHLDTLKKRLVGHVSQPAAGGGVMLVNARHYEALQKSHQALQHVLAGLEQARSNDLLAQDLRDALHHIGLLTGEVHTEDLLHHIFAHFCIGK